MEITIINAAITAAAAIGGAAIAAGMSIVNTRHKIKELEIAASQKLREQYLQNAREYMNAIYIPLTLAISRLYDAHAAFEKDPTTSGAIDLFRRASDTFEGEVQRLRDSGAEAFLTNELEDRLRSFVEFLANSNHATTVTRKAEIGFRIGLGGLTWSEKSSLALTGRSATWWRSPKMSLGLPGVGFTYEATIVQAAPLDSVEFAIRFAQDAGEIRYLIKEVTLGGKPREPAVK